MSNFGKGNVHNFSLVEVLVLLFAIVLVVFVAGPSVSKFAQKLKMNNAIDSAYSYKDSVNNYYVSRLIYDSSFKLDGKYSVKDGNLTSDGDEYSLLLSSNVPSEGYLTYDNNVLQDGCIFIDGYYVLLSGKDVSISNSSCMVEDTQVAFK